jgi:hypothetical protein
VSGTSIAERFLRKEKNSMAMESLNSSVDDHDDDDDDDATSSAVRPRFFPLGTTLGGGAAENFDGEITATRLLIDLRPPKLFEVASLLPGDEDLDDTEEEIVTSVIRRPAAENEDSVDNDPEIVDVIALDDVRDVREVRVVQLQPPPLPLRLPRLLPPRGALESHDRTAFLGTPRRHHHHQRPSQHIMDDAARAALKARLEEVAAAVRRREIDFGAVDSGVTDVTAPLPILPPVAPPFADGGWPLLPWSEAPPSNSTFSNNALFVTPARAAAPRPSPSRRKEQHANNVALAGVAVLMIAGLIMGLSMMRPKTYGSTCTVLCLR